MGKWRSDTHYASNPEWDWKVHERGGSADASNSAAWTDSLDFYDSLYGNATEWVRYNIMYKYIVIDRSAVFPWFAES